MLRDKHLGIVFAAFLLIAVALPASALPAEERAPASESEAHSFVSGVLSWLVETIGIPAVKGSAVASESSSELGISPEPSGREDDTDSFTTSSTGSEEPSNELGIIPEPGG